MNKEGFKILIKAIDDVVFDISLAGVLKGRAMERSLRTKDDIEKEAYKSLQEKAQNDIYKHKNYIRDMMTNFMDNTKEENNEQ